MWGLPGAGIEPASPALTAAFLSTLPPEKCSMFSGFIQATAGVRISCLFEAIFIAWVDHILFIHFTYLLVDTGAASTFSYCE